MFSSKASVQKFSVNTYEELVGLTKQAANLIIEEIKIEEPQFFSVFKARISSGNPAEVKRAFIEGRGKIQKIAKAIREDADHHKLQILNPLGSCVAVAIVIFDVAAAVIAVFVVAVAYLDEYTENGLYVDMAIVDYTKAFRTI